MGGTLYTHPQGTPDNGSRRSVIAGDGTARIAVGGVNLPGNARYTGHYIVGQEGNFGYDGATVSLTGTTCAMRGGNPGTAGSQTAYWSASWGSGSWTGGMGGYVTWAYNAPGAPNAPTVERTNGGTSLKATTGGGSGRITYYNVALKDVTGWNANETTFSVGAHTTYTVRSLAGNEDASTEGSTTLSYGIPNAPTAPTATASATVGGRIDVSWSAPSYVGGGILEYHVYRNDTYVHSTTSTSFADTGLTVGSTYYYTVYARNSTGWGPVSSASSTITANGVPTAPTLSSATPSTTAFGQVILSWTAPSVAVGGVSSYYIYVDGVLNTSSTTSPATVTGLNERQNYTFTVRARNPFAVANNTVGAVSNSIVATSPGPPTQPLNFSGAPDDFIAGRINFTWQTPANTAGGITGYTLYYANTNTVAKTFSNVNSGNITGLIPGVTYTFYLRARNATADLVGTFSAPSATIAVGALGEPEAPGNVQLTPSVVAASRMILSWEEPIGAANGYRIYTGDGTFVDRITATSYAIDNVAPGTTIAYQVRATNSVTDAAGSEGGPLSPVVTGSPTNTTSQTVNDIAVENITNNLFDGSFSLVGTTATTMTFVKATSLTVPQTVVPAGSATAVNTTNTILNGTYNIGVPSDTTLTYSKTIADIPLNTPVPSGQLLNNTNVIFNGTGPFIVTEVDAINKTVSYTRTASDISSRIASGTVSNTTNAVFNGVYKLIGVSDTTLEYDTGGSETLAESAASGEVINVTNNSLFNGTFSVLDVPSYKTFTYYNPIDTPATNLVPNPTMEGAGDVVVVRENLITNPSFEGGTTGWTASGATLATSTSDKFVGSTSMSVACVASGDLVKSSAKYAVSASSVYVLSAWVKVPSGKTITIGLNEYSSSDVLGQTVTTTVIGTGSGQRVSVQITTSSTGVKLEPVLVNTTSGANTFLMDGVLLEQTTIVGPYFDGDTSDSLDFTNEWSGVSGASSSIQTGIELSSYVSGGSDSVVIQSAEWSATGTGE